MDFETHDRNLIDELQSEKEELEAEITALRARLAEVEGALREVISVSDRKTDIYDRAKAALASAGEEALSTRMNSQSFVSSDWLRRPASVRARRPRCAPQKR